MFRGEFLDHVASFGEGREHGEKRLLLRIKMLAHFVVEVADDAMRLFSQDLFARSRGQRALGEQTQRECVLMLVRKRDQCTVAQHFTKSYSLV